VQVGTGSRSEKIKTYNFKDTRVSDHRTKTNFDLNKVCDNACGRAALLGFAHFMRLPMTAAATWKHEG
jgi:hypothetical protein